MFATSLCRSLLETMVRADGDVLVLRVGEKPYVRNAHGRIEIGTRVLPTDVVYALFDRFFPAGARSALRRTSAARCDLPVDPDLADERFTATALQEDVLTVEVQRRRTAASLAAPATANELRPLVLLIDDSVDQLDFYGLVLEDHYRVMQAGHGEKGIQLAQDRKPDVVICDLSMPGLDGWGVCRRLAAHPETASIPIIILTASSEDGLHAQAAHLGAKCLLTKPCSPEMLFEQIDAALLAC
jgi:CheY-like chemotaxis protein